MLILITYDVSTETETGKRRFAKSGKTMCKLWDKSTELGF